MKAQTEHRLEVLIGIVILGALIAVGGMLLFKYMTAQSCLRHGWPQAQITIFLEQYCVKRVNQTDIVKPLEDFK